MSQQYRRHSMSAWIFWAVMIVGGTLYGAYRFDWFSVSFLVPSQKPVADAKSVAPEAREPLPADGQIEVAQSPTGPQTEPPTTEIEEPGEKATRARLMEQRAESPEPKIRANAAIPSAAEPARAVHVDANPFQAADPLAGKATVAELTPTIPSPAAASPVASLPAAASPAAPFVSSPASAVPPPAATKPALPVEKPRSKSNIVQAVSFTEEKEVPPSDPELDAHLEKIDQYLQNSDLLRAHRELSTLYWAKPHWRPTIKERIERTANAIYFDPQPQFLQPYVVKQNDQLAVFAKKYNVPWEYLAKLNHVDAKKIKPGQQLKVIKGPFAAIVELNRFVMTVHAYGYFVKAYKIGIGKDGATPLGKFSVLKKVVNPQYTDPQGQVIEGGDPANPLGDRWLDLGKSYGIHGTIDPNSIGKAESRGCIRLRNEDVEEVYDMLAVGSEIAIRR